MIREVRITEDDFKNLIEFFIREKVGNLPTAITFSSELKKSHRPQDIVSILELALDHLNVDPRIPYPVYIIDKDFRNIQGRMQIFGSVDEIPLFFKKYHHLNRDNDFLWERKREIILSKISKNQWELSLDKIKKMKGLQKEFHHDLKLYSFYGRILLDLQRYEQKNEGEKNG